MRTFKIRPTFLVSGGVPFFPDIDALLVAHPTDVYQGWYYAAFLPDTATIVQVLGSPNGTFGAQIIGQVTTTGFVPKSLNDTLRFSFAGNSIYLDGSLTPISFSGLPAGFTPLTAVLSTYPTPPTFSAPTLQQHFFLQLDALTEGAQDAPSLAYSSPPSAIDLINNGCGVRAAVSITNSGSAGNLSFSELVIEGTYTIDRNAPELKLLNSDVPVYVGDKVKFIITDAELVDSPGAFPLPQGTLNGVEQVQLAWTDSNGDNIMLIDADNNAFDIIIQTTNQLWFYLPWGFRSFSGTVTITFVGDGISFFGSVMAGTLQILFENGSGIYKLDKNQTDDTLYFRAGFITDVQVIMIPNILEDETVLRDDFFDLLPYPANILGQTSVDEDYEASDFFIISSLRVVVSLIDVEIPSPFIKTAFLP